MHASKLISALTIGIMMMASSIAFAATSVVYTNPLIGDYNNTTISIGLTGLAPHSQVGLYFDLYILDSWDASDPTYGGPDRFGFSADGNTQSWTFSNFPSRDTETNTDVATSTGDYNGITTWGYIDRYFDNYNNGFTFAHSDSTLNLSFFGSGLQRLQDESWRVTNLVVTTTGAPLPVAAPFFMFGAGLLGIIRNRKK